MASESASNVSDDAIHVNIDTREVTVPQSQQLFGVESDDGVEIKHIVIDGRYADGNRDLSQLAWRVVYRNANRETSYYLIPSVVANENSIEMDWLIKRSVVAYKGTVDFILCAFATASSGEVTPEWNSTLGQGIVLEGLETSAIDIGKESVDELAKILYETIKARDAAAISATAAAESNEHATATAENIKDSLDQIAENTAAVSKLKEDTAALKDGKISKFYASSQGDTNLPDSDAGRIVDLKLYGKSEQKQYSGYNTIKPFADGRGTESGVTWTIKNGVLTMSGTCTATGAVINIGVTTKDFDANKSKLIYEATGSFAITVQYDFDAMVASDKNAFAISAGKNIRLFMYEGTDYTGTLAVALADVSVSQTSFDPYVGGIPSPNPDYPQEIKSVVNPKLSVCGKNLFPVLSTDNVTLMNKPSGGNRYGYVFEVNEPCRISANVDSIDINVYVGTIDDSNTYKEYATLCLTTGYKYNVAITQNGRYCIYAAGDILGACLRLNDYKIQIEKGSTATKIRTIQR